MAFMHASPSMHNARSRIVVPHCWDESSRITPLPTVARLGHSCRSTTSTLYALMSKFRPYLEGHTYYFRYTVHNRLRPSCGPTTPGHGLYHILIGETRDKRKAGNEREAVIRTGVFQKQFVRIFFFGQLLPLRT